MTTNTADEVTGVGVPLFVIAAFARAKGIPFASEIPLAVACITSAIVALLYVNVFEVVRKHYVDIGQLPVFYFYYAVNSALVSLAVIALFAFITHRW